MLNNALEFTVRFPDTFNVDATEKVSVVAAPPPTVKLLQPGAAVLMTTLWPLVIVTLSTAVGTMPLDQVAVLVQVPLATDTKLPGALENMLMLSIMALGDGPVLSSFCHVNTRRTVVPASEVGSANDCGVLDVADTLCVNKVVKPGIAIAVPLDAGEPSTGVTVLGPYDTKNLSQVSSPEPFQLKDRLIRLSPAGIVTSL